MNSQNTNKNEIVHFSLIALMFLVIGFSVYNVFQIKSLKNSLDFITNKPLKKINNEFSKDNYSNKTNPFEDIQTFSGTVRRETPPADDLGEYWYYLVFDEPYLLSVSAITDFIYVDEIQIVGNNNLVVFDDDGVKNVSLDDFLGRNVKIAGVFAWGLSESSYIEIKAITVK